MTEDFFIEGKKGRIAAKIDLPIGYDINKSDICDKISMVMLCHGFTGGKDKPLLRTIADKLKEKGIASIRFDYMGYGNSYGEFQDMNILDEIDDTLTVYDYVKRLKYVKNISLIGHSQGSIVCIMSFANKPKGTIKNMILLSPAAVLKQDALQGEIFGGKFDAKNPPEYVEIYDGRKLGKQYILTAQNLNIFDTAKDYKDKVLLVYGEEDKIMPYKDVEDFHKTCQNSSICIVKNAGHGFKEKLNETADICANYISSRIE